MRILLTGMVASTLMIGSFFLWGGDFELLELQNFAFFNAVLLTATYYYCVHVVFLPVSLLAV